jgi:hypothetical protein
MKKFIMIIIAGSLVLGFSCTQSIEQDKKEVSTSELTEPMEEAEHHHSENDSIELNKGAKWKVVPDMMRHIRTMESEIKLFLGKKQPELKDYKQLAESLQKSSDLLTSNCTMQGKAHDELHKWLLPYLDLVDRFSKSKNIDEAKQTYEELMASYKTFNLYFN